MSTHEERLVSNARPYNKNFRSLESRLADKSISGPFGPARRKLKFQMKDLDEELLMGDPSPVSNLFHPLLFAADEESIDNFPSLKQLSPVLNFLLSISNSFAGSRSAIILYL